MAGFLYYLPGCERKPDRAGLEECGLGHLAGAELQINRTRTGPDAKAGMVIAADVAGLVAGGEAPYPVGYYPSDQDWHKQKTYWIGIQKNAPPRPIDLAKKEQLSGHTITLGDGNKYIVPVERFLPDKLELDEDGCVQRVPIEAFAPLKELARICWCDYWDAVERSDGGGESESAKSQLTEADQIKLAVHFLGVNYVVGRAEANVLGLWNDVSLSKTLEAIMDIPTVLKMVKKMNEANAKKKDRPADGG